MSDDRELLELAAKAAGIVVKRSRLDDPAMKDLLIEANREAHSTYIGWNPLTDDGDALRLAVKLNLTVQCSFASVWVESAAPKLEIVENHNNKEAAAATRRAIVRAAAEIGKAMPAAKAGKGGGV